MHYISGMKEINCAQSIIQYSKYMVFVEFDALSWVKYFLEVLVQVLHHQENVVKVLNWAWRYDIYQVCGKHVVFHVSQIS